MVGNDVVDLRETRRRARHPRFDERVFTSGERRAIAAAKDPEECRWAFWAAKESAYKIARRANPAAGFSPVRFEVELDDALCGQVRYAGDHYPVEVARRGDCIHAIARSAANPQPPMLAGIEALPTLGDRKALGRAQSRAVRALAIREIAPRVGATASDLRVRPSNRIPLLERRDGSEVATLSLSHHGRYVAYACSLPDASDEVRA